MFCQKCGAELRLEAGFCAVCGATIARPTLHSDEDHHARRGGDTHKRSQTGADNGAAPQAIAPRRAPGAPYSAPSALISTPPTYQAIRHAAQRGGARNLAPIASLQVPARQSSAAPRAATPQARPVEPSAPAQPIAAPDQPLPASAPPFAASAPAQPLVAPGQPLLLPVPPTTAMVPVQPMVAPGQPLLVPAQALAVPTAPGSVQQLFNGYHPVGWAIPAGSAYASNGAAVPSGSAPLPMAGAPGSMRLPADTPNRLALGALIGMFFSFFLPWVIIGSSRSTPLTVGWPVIVPLAVIAATGLTILLPERTLYTRFFLALPLALGCFALGSALLIFLLSSAIAMNTVGVGFLGVDIGFAFFTLGAFVLACAGYFKLIRELPLLLAGRLRLAPLPGALSGLSAPPPHVPYSAAVPYSTSNSASQNGAASAGEAAEGEG